VNNVTLNSGGGSALLNESAGRVSELRFEHKLFVDGRWIDATSGERFAVEDPATGEVIADLPRAGTADTLAAVESANRALTNWRRTSVLKRADLLLRLVELIDQHREPLAQLAVLEQGVPLVASRGGVDYANSFFRWFAEEARRIYGHTIAHPDPSRRLQVDYHPRGVAGIITPWNGPLASPAKKVAAAIAAGCTVVIKPSELTPLSALALAWLASEAGIPNGVINVVCGDAPAIGRVLLEHPDVPTISFTGSLRTGRYLYARAARRIKHVLLELGGNAPYIVFEDADLDRAADDLVWLKKSNSGQVCVTANRIYVQRGVFHEFSECLTDRYGKLPIGNGFTTGVEQGPLITSQAVNRVDQLVQEARGQGAKVLCGGQRLELGPNFYPPTILSNVTRDMRMANEEIFGPVMPLASFETEEEVVLLANNTQQRLSAYAYTQNFDRALRLSRELDFGVVGLNDPRPITCEAPFGGNRLGGIGREGGREGLLDFMDARLVGFRIAELPSNKQ
jgi:succinate-semialdehyde dehydrogenase / glutarate-semialdehyde dehydrogenase